MGVIKGFFFLQTRRPRSIPNSLQAAAKTQTLNLILLACSCERILMATETVTPDAIESTKNKGKSKRHPINIKRIYEEPRSGGGGSWIMSDADWEKIDLSKRTMNAIKEIGVHRMTQTCDVAGELLKNDSQCLLVAGVVAFRFESDKVADGANILVATPDWLLYQLQGNLDFFNVNLQYLVIGEADRILEAGFELEMQLILDKLPRWDNRLLFSVLHIQRRFWILQDCLVRQNLCMIWIRHVPQAQAFIKVEVEGAV